MSSADNFVPATKHPLELYWLFRLSADFIFLNDIQIHVGLYDT